jgi:nucleoside 2-deoxyribosyltransferase
MSKPLVYLAGAIAGLPYDDATDWRNIAKHRLAERGIEVLNPMRAKHALGERNAGHISGNFHDYEGMGSFFIAKGIMTRDSTDVRRCDALLVNLLGLTKVSAGTVMELGWGFILPNPSVVAIEATGNPHDNHPMIHEAMPFRGTTLEAPVDSVAVLLNR